MAQSRSVLERFSASRRYWHEGHGVGIIDSRIHNRQRRNKVSQEMVLMVRVLSSCGSRGSGRRETWLPDVIGARAFQCLALAPQCQRQGRPLHINTRIILLTCDYTPCPLTPILDLPTGMTLVCLSLLRSMTRASTERRAPASTTMAHKSDEAALASCPGRANLSRPSGNTTIIDSLSGAV